MQAIGRRFDSVHLHQLNFGLMIVLRHTDGEAAVESAFKRDALSRPTWGHSSAWNERLSCKQDVESSNLSGSTIFTCIKTRKQPDYRCCQARSHLCWQICRHSMRTRMALIQPSKLLIRVQISVSAPIFYALVAHLDRVLGYEPGSSKFEPCQAHQME